MPAGMNQNHDCIQFLHQQNECYGIPLVKLINTLKLHITLLVGEKLCRVNNIINIINIMFEYLGLAYRDSDYTCTDLNVKVAAKTHLGGGDMSDFVSPWPPLLERSIDFRWQYRS